MNKYIGIFSFILVGWLVFYCISCFVGADSNSASSISKYKADDFFDQLHLQNCRKEYGNSERIWDCSVSKGKRCSLSLSVINDTTNDGLVFIDDLQVKARYEVRGLTQVWSFEDGSKYELEPDGIARYIKSAESTKKANEITFYTSYECTSVSNITN